MKIFITGATGFIGSHVAFRLLAAGHELVAIARNPNKLPALSTHPKVRRVTATLLDHDVIHAELAGCDACIHVALGWGNTPLEMLRADTTATVALLDSCIAQGVTRFIYTSSTAALGPFFAEMQETDPTRPSDYYGATKAASEAFVLAVGAQTAMRCNVIRPGYTFGNPVVPGATTQPDRRFRDIVKSAVRNEPIVLKAGDGTQFIAAPDLAHLYESLLLSPHNREVFYGLGASYVSWETIARKAIALCQSKSQLCLEGESRTPCLFNLKKLQDHFGFAFEAEPYLTQHVQYWVSLLS
jgi:UDP-glucose 4-epimerase